MNELFIEPSPSYLLTAWFIYSPICRYSSQLKGPESKEACSHAHNQARIRWLPFMPQKQPQEKSLFSIINRPKTKILCYDNPTRISCSTKFSLGTCAQKDTKEWKQIKHRCQNQAGEREKPRLQHLKFFGITPSHWKKTPKIIYYTHKHANTEF